MTDWRARKSTNLLLLLIGAVLVACLVMLGNWQVRRLDWKVGLINAVETRAHGTPVEAPPYEDWHAINADSHAYLRVTAQGNLLHNNEIAVQAVTEIGAGYWIMTPLVRENSETIWINRGFVPPELRDPATRPNVDSEAVSVTGLLRISEPEGTVLQSNDPATNRWYSRDVDAFSLHKGLSDTAPFFIDAGAGEDPQAWPRGGMTRIDFRNSHLVYALTWYSMAALLAGAMVYVVWLSRRPPADGDD
ncbi:MAG: SURF1 family protein [Pseudomonadota bacterium]